MISEKPFSRRTKRFVRSLSISIAIATGVFILIKSDSFIATRSIAQSNTPINDPSTQSQQNVAASVSDSQNTSSDGDAPDGISADTIQTYVVKSGDTLSSIAVKFSISSDTIRSSNDISSKDTIKVGQKLVILPISGVQYTVKKGDTLSGIAVKYKTTIDLITSFNDLSDAHKIQPGMQLIIPTKNSISSDTSVVVKNTSKSVASSSVTSFTKESVPVSPVVVPSVSVVTPVPLINPSTSTAPVAIVQTPDVSPVATVVPTPISTPNTSAYFIQPIPGSILTQGLHDANAVDFGAPVGTTVRAAATGMVIIAKSGYNGGYGNYIVIQHANGMQTLYAHLSKLLVTEGGDVTQGQTIALSGATGRVTGPHLHFEVRGGENPWTHDAKGTQY